MDTNTEKRKQFIAEYIPNEGHSLNQQVGKIVRLLRESEKLSQEAFGYELGSAASTISHMERGKSNIKIATLGAIASMYNKQLVISFVNS